MLEKFIIIRSRTKNILRFLEYIKNTFLYSSSLVIHIVKLLGYLYSVQAHIVYIDKNMTNTWKVEFVLEFTLCVMLIFKEKTNRC